MGNLPTTKVRDVPHPRLQVPDPDSMESFLMDFGPSHAQCTDDSLYLRCAASAVYGQVVHLGQPQFLGFAFHLNSREAVTRLAASAGFATIAAPAQADGGWRSTPCDLDGNMVGAVCGRSPSYHVTDRPMGAGFARDLRANHFAVNTTYPKAEQCKK